MWVYIYRERERGRERESLWPILVRYCTLLDCESFINVDFISLFVRFDCVRGTRFPLTGIKRKLKSI